MASLELFPENGRKYKLLGLNLAEELKPMGIHLAVVTVNGRVIAGTPYPDAIADRFWELYSESSGNWQHEIATVPSA
jgi:hypothetical protein